MAGFEVTFRGRFWVTPEVPYDEEPEGHFTPEHDRLLTAIIFGNYGQVLRFVTGQSYVEEVRASWKFGFSVRYYELTEKQYLALLKWVEAERAAGHHLGEA